jgi:hypothetical protein
MILTPSKTAQDCAILTVKVPERTARAAIGDSGLVAEQRFRFDVPAMMAAFGPPEGSAAK